MQNDHDDEEIIELDDVEVLDEDEDRLLCSIGEADVWILKEHVSIYSEIHEKGDVGILVLPGWVVDDLELIV